jgi:adenylate cyclase
MAAPQASLNGNAAAAEQNRGIRGWLLTQLDWFVSRQPFLSLFVVIFASNALGSFFNIRYNNDLIVAHHLTMAQKQVFYRVALPLYNAVAYPVGISLTIYLLWPLARFRNRLRAGQQVSSAALELCRMRLINLPFLQVCINMLGWLPGAVVFPLLITTLGGMEKVETIWLQFIASFLVSALLTTAQTFFLMETFLIRYFYPDFFKEARPAEARGVIRIPFGTRLFLMGSTMIVPLLALLLVAWNFEPGFDHQNLKWLAVQVTLFGAASGAFVFWLVGYDIGRWVVAHSAATEKIEAENYDVHIDQKRPDEWGRLTDRFNDMVDALARARRVRETFGQFVGAEERDDILQNYPGLGGQEQEVTVLFTDIRGFTRLSAGASPTRTVELLNRFLTLALNAVGAQGGTAIKFLGDGVMAVFGPRRLRANHALQAVTAARDLLRQLAALNAELVEQGQQPLRVGVGIHTGPAVIGCIGAQVTLPDGRTSLRKEFTAIGETVNLAQRLEQLTKCCPGPILMSNETRARLGDGWQLVEHGPIEIPGFDAALMVYQICEP